MGFIRQYLAKRLAAQEVDVALRTVDRARMEVDFLTESMSTLQLELENLQYKRLTANGDECSYARDHIRNIVELALQMGRKNPITVRSINVQADYVFGQGVSFNAEDENVQTVIDEFTDYRENRKVLTSHTAMLRAAKREQVYGSMFFVMNTNPETGRVIVRNLPANEVEHIIKDPNDRERELWIHHVVSGEGGGEVNVYHPAYGVYEMSGHPLPWQIDRTFKEGPIMWAAPVLHVAANRLGDEDFAVPEVYPQLDWALTLKRLYEQYVTIMAAFSRMAMKISGLKGRKQAAAAKALVATKVSLTQPNETNPSPATGSTALLGVNNDIEPIKTAGATTPASDFDPILNFAGTAVGLPNTFFGDAGKGNFATAKTLDRPTELKMISKQKLWKEIFRDILDYVKMVSAAAPGGTLRKAGWSVTLGLDPFLGEYIPILVPPADASVYVDVFFPDVLERNVTDRVRALTNALTLFGKPLTDIVPDKRLAAQWLLEALGVPNAKSYIPEFIVMWEKNMKAEDGKPVEAIIIPPPPPQGGGLGAEDPSQGGAVGSNG